MDKYSVYRFLEESPEIKDDIKRDAARLPQPPKDPTLLMAFENGKRWYAAKLLDRWQEVHDERTLGK